MVFRMGRKHRVLFKGREREGQESYVGLLQRHRLTTQMEDQWFLEKTGI